MKREDFVFDHMDDEYEDYWFKVVGDTKDELTKEVLASIYLLLVSGSIILHGISDTSCPSLGLSL